MNLGSFLKHSLFLSIPLFRKILTAATGSSAWLIDAIELKNIYHSKDKRVSGLVNEIYLEVIPHIKKQTPAKTKKTKEAIETVLLSLWMGAFFNQPIRYSRNHNDYTSAGRYGQLSMSIGCLIPVIDAFEKLGYIKQKKGFYIFDKKFGYQTRIWATEALLQGFEGAGLCDYGFFTDVRPKDTIILRDKQKRQIQYIEERKTIKWREQVEKYNNCIDNSKITVVLNSEVPVSIRFLIQYLYRYVIKGTVRINTVNLIQQDLLIPYHNQYYPNTNYIQYHYILSTMTKKKSWNSESVVPIHEFTRTMMLHNYLHDVNVFVRAFDDFDHANAFLNQTVLLKDIGIEYLEFQLVYEYLHRVFNDSSFSLGGRFNGALHLNMPRNLRPFIEIDGQSTVELDYSAYHIKMLYHMAGIDYQEDPYSVCEGPALRKIYKAVGLIAINAENEKKAYGAITNGLKDRGLKAPKREKPIVSLVNAFKQAHMPIKKYIFSGIGKRLQNKDSDIMNSILARLLEKGICGLPMHDSVIVPVQHKNILEALMIEEYQKRMGFKPVVDVK